MANKKISQGTLRTAPLHTDMLPLAADGSSTAYKVELGDLIEHVLGRVINVKWYGALGDGITDDTAAIQAAIDAAGYNKIVFFPEGTYMISGELYVDRGATLEGVGAQHSIIKAMPAFNFTSSEVAMIHQRRDGSPVLYATVGPTERFYLRHIYIHGNDVAGANGILCSLQQPAAWYDVRVQNCPGYGVALCDTQQAYFYNLQITKCGVCLRMRGVGLCGFFGINLETYAGGEGNTTSVLILEELSGFGGCYDNSFYRTHLEGTLSGTDKRFIDIQSAENTEFDGLYCTGTGTETVFYFASVGAAEETAPVYQLRNIRMSGASMTALYDVDRGINLNAHDDFRNFIPLLIAPNENPVSGAWQGNNGVTVVNLGNIVNRLG